MFRLPLEYYLYRLGHWTGSVYLLAAYLYRHQATLSPAA